MNVLDELIEDGIDRSYVERRVDDWEARVSGLYDDVTAWLPDGWTSRRSRTTAMHEGLMRRFDLAERRIPILDFVNDSTERGRLEPRGLWIIGANGRLDLMLARRHYLIVDQSDSFERPDWRLSELHNRLNDRPFTQSSLLMILA